MIKVDLHLHSKASKNPGGYLSKKMSLSESYVEPIDIYKTLKERGMTLVTITDHDSIDGCLEIAHLPDTFISEEITTYFPEDKTKVHVIAIDINEKHHKELQYLRHNIYDLVDYMQKNDITYILAHPLYDMDGKLNKTHVEKFLLMFDVWEVINGTRSKLSSELTKRIAQKYSKDDIECLANKYGFLKRKSDVISFTAGSDDHGGLDIGTTYTVCEGQTVNDLKKALKEASTIPEGIHGDPKRLSHMIMNIVRSGLKNKVYLGSFGDVVDNLFHDRQKNTSTSIIDSIFGRNQVHQFIHNVTNFNGNGYKDKHDRIFYFFKNLFPYFISNSLNGKKISLDMLSSVIQKAIISLIPTLTYISVYHQRALEKKKSLDLYNSIFEMPYSERNKVAYFTDTFFEINGVSITTHKILELSKKYNLDIKFVISSQMDIKSEKIVNFKPTFTFPLPEYPDIKVNIPNFLEVLDYIEREDFNIIYCATPGILGIYGLVIAKILGKKFISTYHTDFPSYVYKLTSEKTFADITKTYMRLFYSMADKVLVPSNYVKNNLERIGVNSDKMEIFRRGVNLEKFNPKYRDKSFWKIYDPNYNDEFVMLYVGRVSKEKDIDIFVEVSKMFLENKKVKFFIVGDGPYKETIKNMVGDNVIFTGFLRDESLSKAYASADVFLFPSTTETFGNVILEALASGLICMVSDKGAAREFIVDGVNGCIVADNNLKEYYIKLNTLLNNRSLLEKMRKNALKYVENYKEEELLIEMVNKIGINFEAQPEVLTYENQEELLYSAEGV
ncbi:MAG: glycosyltransferase [Hydrogenothermaceae bacterium]